MELDHLIYCMGQPQQALPKCCRSAILLTIGYFEPHLLARQHFLCFAQEKHKAQTKQIWQMEQKVAPCQRHVAQVWISERIIIINRIVGKSMLKNKSPQIGRECISSYVGYILDKHIIAYVVVEHDSNMKSKHRK